MVCTSVEVHLRCTSPLPKKLESTFKKLLPDSFAEDFHVQCLHVARELTYNISLPHSIETSHIHIKKAIKNNFIAYHIPFETHQEEFL